MNGRIIRVRGAAVALAALGCLLFPSRTALGQAGTDSDVLQITVTDPSGINVVPPKTFTIPETSAGEGTPISFTVPAQNFLFREATNGGPSDYLHIDSFFFQITSNAEKPLALRTTVPTRVIPSEVFSPVLLLASSDADLLTTGGPGSDRVTIFTGLFGQPPAPTFDQAITEPASETVPEDRINFFTGPLFFDLLEPGSTIDVSDYFDSPNGLTGFFISSDNPADFAGLPPPDGTILEDPINGTTLQVNIRFASDAEVPEPSTIVLAGMAAVGVIMLARRR